MAEIVELRSDTFTKPTPDMRRAMAEAEVGDDVWGEDPTANALQAQCAELFGKEAGLFVPSGSMGNEAAINVQTSPGEEIIAEANAHIVAAELGAPATISQVLVRVLQGRRGALDPDELAAAINPPARFTSPTALVCLENTHWDSGGAVIPIDVFKGLAKIVRERNVKLHLDGARIFNASVASGVPVREYAAEVDTLTFCFSKGLGAPIGSMLLGPRDVIERARRVRKMLGGGMRQVGVLCAAAKVALETGVDRLAEDHANARRFAEGLADAWPGSVDPEDVETNIVNVDTGERDARTVETSLRERSILTRALDDRTLCCYTHRDVDAAGIERAIAAFRALK
jgi:threonine aldolase